MLSSPGLDLLAVLQPSSVDARRGVVRVHPEVLAALGAHPWDPLLLTGTRVTGALAGLAPAGGDRRVLYADELALANLGVVSQTSVRVERAVVRAADTLTVRAAPQVRASVGPEVVRAALLGKVVTRGDTLSLLPQDVALPPGASTAMLDDARRQLATQVGAGWTAILIELLDGPVEPAVVTMATVVRFDDGKQTSGSATPGTAYAAPAPAPSRVPLSTPPPPGVPAEELPGLERQAAALREWWDLGFHRADLLTSLGTTASMGVLVSGPAGSGKVGLVRGVAARLGASVVHLWAPALAALAPDAAALRLRAAVEEARRVNPCVLLIEDVEALTPRADPGPLATLVLEEVAGVVAGGRVAVACTTSRPEQVTGDLRRPGLLEHQVAIPLPDRAQRRRLLEALLSALPLAPDISLDEIAGRTPGFVAADLQALGREAAGRAALRLRAEDGQDGAGEGGPKGPPTVTAADLDGALEVVRPTAMSESTLEVGRVTLDEVGDMAEVKAALTEAVLWPLHYPETFSRLGIDPPRGVLMYGPPGCGKTFLVKALAGTGEANVLSVKGAEVLSKWVGESEAGVREVFRRAREAAPTLVFLDEVDALAPVRGQSTDSGVTDRVVAALLTELDGVEELRDVVVVAATNRPDLVDPALLRPGRLERLVFVPPPDGAARAEILRVAARRVPLDGDVDLAALAATLDGYSAADCTALVREAALTAMRRSLDAPSVTAADVAAARAAVRPSLKAEQVAALQAFADARRGT